MMTRNVTRTLISTDMAAPELTGDSPRTRRRKVPFAGTAGGMSWRMLRTPIRCRRPRLPCPPHANDSRKTSRRPDAARDLHRHQSGAGLCRSCHQGGARAGGRDRARARQRAGVPFTINGANGVQGRDRQREERRGRHRLRGIRSGARRAGRLLAELCAGAEHLLVPESSPINRSRMPTARACASASARAMPANYFLTRTLKECRAQAQRRRHLDARSSTAAGEIDAYAGNRMRLHGAVQKTPGCASCRTISTASSRR